MDYSELWKILRTLPHQKEPNFRANIVTYNAGDIAKATAYIQIFGSTGSHAELRIAIADTIAQLHILCEMHSLDFNALDDLGKIRLIDRTKELMEKT